PMIPVEFKHYRYELDRDTLVRYGSPHFSAGEVSTHLAGVVASSGLMPVSSCTLDFEEGHIICANEAFPEAAIADPLSDLAVWSDWRSGVRSFPYPGVYPRLGIIDQGPKTQSATSIGVVGEIMAGLFAQAGIAPWVIVRVIRRWPDLIFLTADGGFDFVEAKAFTLGARDKPLWDSVPSRLVGDHMHDAVHQLNADASVGVWGAFTRVVDPYPCKLEVTFLEVVAEPVVVSEESANQVPAAVVLGIAQQLTALGVGTLSNEEIEILETRKTARRRVEDRVVENGLRFLDQDGTYARIRDRFESNEMQDLRKNMRQLARKLSPNEMVGRYMSSVRSKAANEEWARLRPLATGEISIGNLAMDEVSEITNSWGRNWENANKPYGKRWHTDIWRCGGALFGIGSDQSEDLFA
ncbi:hypothetical protein ACFLRO_00525, partial [Bacteroidota bacterium]